MRSDSRELRPIVFYAIVLLVFISDQLSKMWIQRVMFWEESRPIIGDIFRLTLTRNTGGAWGLLPDGNPIFVVFAIIAIVALVFAYHRMSRVDLLVGAAFALALGGALGNLLDRLRYQYVVDFFEARIIHWPIFNIADSAISLGIVLLLAHFALSRQGEQPTALPQNVALVAEESPPRSSKPEL
jgi:signal peptidase II